MKLISKSGYVMLLSWTLPMLLFWILGAVLDSSAAQREALWTPMSEAVFVPQPQPMPAYMPPVASPPMLQPTFAVDSTFQHQAEYLPQVPVLSNEQLFREVLPLSGSLLQPPPAWEPHIPLDSQCTTKALAPAQASLDAAFGQPIPTVCQVASLEFQVKNTFINIVMPSTPSARASRRTQSCPRGM